jgi:hypothetical protein
MDPLEVIMHCMIIEQDLITVAVVVDCNGGVWPHESVLKTLSLLGTPVARCSLAIEDDHLFSATDGDMKEDITFIFEVDGSVNLRGIQVEGSRLEDDNTVGIELALELD